jgi:hypothetical protein
MPKVALIPNVHTALTDQVTSSLLQTNSEPSTNVLVRQKKFPSYADSLDANRSVELDIQGLNLT